MIISSYFFSNENWTKYHVGMTFNIILDDNFVWVANRDFPLPSSKTNFTIHKEGNLVFVIEESIFFAMQILIAVT